MTTPHIVIEDNGDVRLRLSSEDMKILMSHDEARVLGLRDRLRGPYFVAQCEAALRSEAAA